MLPLLLSPGFLGPTVTLGISEAATRYNDAQLTYNTPSATDLRKVNEPYRGGQELSIDVGALVSPKLAIDLHAAISTTEAAQTVQFENYVPGYNGDAPYPYLYHPLELGVGITYAFAGRWWVAPWLGLAQVRVGKRFFMPYCDACSVSGPGVGTQLGFDVVSDHHNRLSIFVHGTYSKLRSGDEPSDSFGEGASLRQVGIGLAYRYF